MLYYSVQCALCKTGTTMELLFLKYNYMDVNVCVLEDRVSSLGIQSLKTNMGKKLGAKIQPEVVVGRTIFG